MCADLDAGVWGADVCGAGVSEAGAGATVTRRVTSESQISNPSPGIRVSHELSAFRFGDSGVNRAGVNRAGVIGTGVIGDSAAWRCMTGCSPPPPVVGLSHVSRETVSRETTGPDRLAPRGPVVDVAYESSKGSRTIRSATTGSSTASESRGRFQPCWLTGAIERNKSARSAHDGSPSGSLSDRSTPTGPLRNRSALARSRCESSRLRWPVSVRSSLGLLMADVAIAGWSTTESCVPVQEAAMAARMWRHCDRAFLAGSVREYACCEKSAVRQEASGSQTRPASSWHRVSFHGHRSCRTPGLSDAQLVGSHICRTSRLVGRPACRMSRYRTSAGGTKLVDGSLLRTRRS